MPESITNLKKTFLPLSYSQKKSLHLYTLPNINDMQKHHPSHVVPETKKKFSIKKGLL